MASTTNSNIIFYKFAIKLHMHVIASYTWYTAKNVVWRHMCIRFACERIAHYACMTSSQAILQTYVNTRLFRRRLRAGARVVKPTRWRTTVVVNSNTSPWRRHRWRRWKRWRLGVHSAAATAVAAAAMLLLLGLTRHNALGWIVDTGLEGATQCVRARERHWNGDDSCLLRLEVQVHSYMYAYVRVQLCNLRSESVLLQYTV